MKLAALFENQPDGNYTYLLTDGGTAPDTAATPWFGAYIAARQPQNLEALTTLSGIISSFENQQAFTQLAFIYFGNGVPADKIAELGAALDKVTWTKPINSTFMFPGVVAWIDQPLEATQAVFEAASRLPFEMTRSGPFLTAPEKQPLLTLSSAKTDTAQLFLTGSISLKSNAGDDGLALGQGSSIPVATGAASASSNNVVAKTDTNGVTLPCQGANAGAMTFAGQLETPISSVGVGFSYALELPVTSQAPVDTEGNKLTSGAVEYPILNAQDGLSGRPASAEIAILAPMDINRTRLVLQPGSPGQPIQSSLRTILGRAVLLTPSASGNSLLVFNLASGDRLYFTPHGPYTLGIENPGTANGDNLNCQLLCGLSGVEYLHFAEGDLLQFNSGQRAGVDVEIVDLKLPPGQNVTYAFPKYGSPPPNFTTAWSMVLPPSGSTDSQGRQYYSEPDQAPFFNNPSGAKSEFQLDYFGLTRTSLPDSANSKDGPNQFPMVPYAMVQAATSGIGEFPPYVEALEYQLLNPTRKTRIEKMADAASGISSHSQSTVGKITAVTPQGYTAAFEGGKWVGIDVAQMGAVGTKTHIQLSFAPSKGEAEIPVALQQAFLTNQQFLVITDQSNLGSSIATVKMDDWPFDLAQPSSETVGDYKNVILFKSANATIAQMAGHPELWTRRKDFTDTGSDPDGKYISSWLVNYLEEARTSYDEGKGVASLQEFVELIDNPLWNGFLVLRVDVGVENLPAPIEVLLAGIDKNLFFAHHIGNRVNHVQPPSGGSTDYTLNSSMFGLVHYADPALSGSAPDYLSSPQDYDFRVLTLEAIFENARLLNFSNKSLLLLNKMFGDAVSAHAPDQDLIAHNNLLLIGTYKQEKQENGTTIPASYTFATGQGTATDFYMTSNAFERIQITKAAMTVVEVGPQDALDYVARFSMWGNMRFLDNSAFDLLSYEAASFQNLLVEMTVPAGGATKTFKFATDSLALALNKNKLPDTSGDNSAPPDPAFNIVRQDSLLAQFPLRLTGFQIGTKDQQPQDNGFRLLETTKPNGISSANLDGGNWYALGFEMNLGSGGALGANGGLTADLSLAWAPGGNGTAQIAPFFKLSGPGGISLSFDLEGVIKFGAKDIVLNRFKTGTADDDPEQFVMIFESIALSLLTLSFPPAGSTNVSLFGDISEQNAGAEINPTLGWFGGFVAKQASSSDAAGS